ncbi:MAG TPA: sigma-70 family RNA polymerase sigma factor [Thermoanaerobaculia bacterium]|jgi:RNA polymerase sigma-70 factor (ECF subfamily)|nr:sigma-70 family RNA polymerase sigma factor [Thermoanaerobaculia bacterium]
MAVSEQDSHPESTFEDLIERVHPRLRKILSRYRIPPQDAEDLMQEAFLILVTKWGSVQNPEAWLLATLANRCIIYWRKSRSRLWDLVDGVVLELLAEVGPPAQDGMDLRMDLEALVANLPDRCRSLLRLRYQLGCTTTEAAEKTGYCRSSIRKVTRRCISALATQLLGQPLAAAADSSFEP